MIDLAAWLTTAEVCARLGVSERTLDREVRAQRWQPRRRQRAGKKPERVFDPHEVWEREQKPTTELVRSGAIPPGTQTTAPPQAELTGSSQWDAAWHVIAPRLLAAMVAEKPAAPALFVSLDEAAQVTGLSRGYLKRLILAGALPANHGGPHGAIRVRRGDLMQIDLAAYGRKAGA